MFETVSSWWFFKMELIITTATTASYFQRHFLLFSLEEFDIGPEQCLVLLWIVRNGRDERRGVRLHKQVDTLLAHKRHGDIRGSEWPRR